MHRAPGQAARAALGALARAPADRAAAPRCLVVAAHPDDETIGVGALLASLPQALVVHATDGAPADPALRARGAPEDRAAYAEARRRELDAALAIAGVSPARRVALDYGDQELARHIDDAARRLAALLEATAAELVVTHAYEGGHPDHDATAIAVHAAVSLAARRGVRAPVPVIEMSAYHAGDGGRLVTASFLPSPEPTIVRRLDPEERARKRRMLDAFATQRETLAPFDVLIEPLRVAPRYDFARLPHDGPLHYERLGWATTGAALSAQAAAALAALSLPCRVEDWAP